MSRIPNVTWVDAPNPLALADRLAQHVATTLAEGILARGTASLVVPGGTTPTAFLTALAAHPLEWDKVFVTVSDERWVPTGDPRSNVAMVARTLRQGPGISARIVSLYEADKTVQEGAEVWHPPAFDGPFDAVVLGMGTDGHTASLFPHTHSFDASLKAPASTWAWPITDAPQPEARVSLTPGRLVNTRMLAVLAHGEAKREVLRAACLPESVQALPLRWFLHRPDLGAHIYHAPESQP